MLQFPLRHLKLGPICDVHISFLYKLPELEFLDISLAQYSVNNDNNSNLVSCTFLCQRCYNRPARPIPHFICGSAISIVELTCRTEFSVDLMECLSQTTVLIVQFSVGLHGLQINMIVTTPDSLPDLCVLDLLMWTAKHNAHGCSSLLM
jgi:hypothetical protein